VNVETIELDPRSIVVAVAAAFGLGALIALADAARHVVTWTVIGALLALALDPVVRALERRLGVRRSIALAFVIIILIAVANVAIVALGPAATREATKFSRDLPGVVQRLGDLPIVGPRLRRADAPAKIGDWLQKLPARLSDNPKPLEAITSSVLGGALAASATTLVTIVLLLDGRRLKTAARRLVPADRQGQFDRVLGITYRTVGRYFAGSLLLATLTGLAMLVAGLVIGVPLIPLVALWAAVTNLIPQVGGFLGGSAFVLIGLTKSPGTAFACLAYFLVWQQIENHVLNPTIVGDAVNLSPPATMLAALAGGATAGVPGALVAVPLLGAAKSIFFELRPGARTAPRRRRRRGLFRNLARRAYLSRQRHKRR
jgi:putative heme transporter